MLLHLLAIAVRRISHAPVSMMDKAGRRLLAPDGQVEHGQCQFMTKMLGHRPAHDFGRLQIHHSREIKPALLGPDVSDVGHLNAVRRLCREVAREQVGRDGNGMATDGVPAEPALSPRGQPHAAHQPRDPLAADPVALGAQFGMHTRAAIATTARLMGRPYEVAEGTILGGTRGLGPPDLGVVAAPANVQHLAQGLTRKVDDVLLDDHAPHLPPVARPKMCAARFKISRSMRNRPSSLHRRAIWAAWSAGLGPTRCVGVA